jgi:hypothetical protein
VQLIAPRCKARIWRAALGTPSGDLGCEHSPFACGPPFKFGTLARFLRPDFVPPERTVAEVEGWILGVDGAHAGV